MTGSPEAERAVGWAVEAFRRAGVDEVHTEKFKVPSGRHEGHTKAGRLSPKMWWRKFADGRSRTNSSCSGRSSIRGVRGQVR